jgi:2-polyprenyl-3-methyl-5-hydroxy-6-metoxy-1,4-benzoquinol methylase
MKGLDYDPEMGRPRIGILIVAYNAVTTLASVLDRIPESFRPSITVVLVSDDHSSDDTYEIGLEYQRANTGLPITVVRQRRNLGYGGNQKFGYRWLIENGADIAVLLHGDGQYAPEVLPEIVGPLLEGRADVVMGSRMLGNSALAGGMPLYKYVGNKILTRFQNRVSGLRLSEWHSGYRAFSLSALERIPFEENSDGFDFDTEVLLQLYDSGARIIEIPIPTYYGDEICRVNGIAYAKDVCVDVVRYRLARLGFGASHLARWSTAYAWKDAPDASHRVVLGCVEDENTPRRVLDLGCAGGFLAAELRERGDCVVGVDAAPSEETSRHVDRLVVADLDQGLPDAAADEGPFDLVLAADVLEHLRDPARLLKELHRICTVDAALVVSVPNIAHWYPRVRVGLGRFDYDRRGILDATHLRFFTWRSFVGMAYRAGWLVERRRLTGLPLEILDAGSGHGRRGALWGAVSRVDRLGRAVWPTLFAYQYVAVLRRDPARLGPHEATQQRSERIIATAAVER